MALVPISTKALSWTIAESGYTKTQLEQKLKLEHGTVDLWLDGEKQPNKTEFKKLKSALKRPKAAFFMDSPPTLTESLVEMRYGFGAKEKNRTPEERVWIRDAFRVRRFIENVIDSMDRDSKFLSSASSNEDPEIVATSVRQNLFKVSIEEQMSWESPSQAFSEWRSEIERLGILVFLYPLGEKSSRGFAIAHESPPLIGISTTWHPTVRVYTLFHELAHILTRTSSSCLEGSSTSSTPSKDPIERWCEKFAAAFLMPSEDLEHNPKLLPRNQTDPIAISRTLSNKLHVSRRSALLRLVETGHASWDDFRRLDRPNEQKQRGGRANPDKLRTRDVVRKHSYGGCLSIVHEAYSTGNVTEADIRKYLQMLPEEIS